MGKDDRAVTKVDDPTGNLQREFVEDMTAKTLELRAKGYSFRQIGAKIGVSGNSAHRWYTRARAKKLASIRGLREEAFYRDLASIQDKIDSLEAVWEATPEGLPMLAGLLRLYDSKAKLLRYSDLEMAEESTTPPTEEELAARLERVRRIMGRQLTAGEE